MLQRRDKSELGESCGDDAEQASSIWTMTVAKSVNMGQSSCGSFLHL